MENALRMLTDAARKYVIIFLCIVVVITLVIS